MSTVLNAYFLDIPPGYVPLQMQNRFVGHLTDNGWQVLAQVDGSYTDLIPPATETIGTSTFREVVRLYFPDNVTVKVGSYQACIADAFSQSFMLTALTAGAVAAAVTIAGVTVTGAVGTSGSTARDNLRALFYALKDSVDVTITGWDYWYDGKDTLIATRKTKAAAVTVTANANVTYSPLGAPVLAGAQSNLARNDVVQAYGVTVDLTNGFVYYMEVCSRSFALHTKCNSGVTGGIFASYADHAEALAVMPSSSTCTPIELFIGYSGESSGKVYAKPTHWWSIPTKYGSRVIADTGITQGLLNNDTIGDCHPFTGAVMKGAPSDAGVTYWAGSGTIIAPEVIFAELGGDTGPGSGSTQFKVVPVSTLGTVVAGVSSTYSFSIRFSPAVNLPDIFKWNGSESLETSCWANQPPMPGVLGSGLTLQQAMDATTAYTSLTFSSTAGLNAAGGSFMIGSERCTYTGTSGGNTATGITRAVDGTVMARHFVGDPVSPGSWFLKINNSAVWCGPTKPA